MSDTRISEAASENGSPPKMERGKRGRPRATDAADDKHLAACVQYGLITAKSRRGVLDAHFRYRAMNILGGGKDRRFLWLQDKRAIDAGEDTMKMSILSELGRISDPDAMLEMAKVICRTKPTARRATHTIRAFRGVQKQRDLTVLTHGIAKSIDAYCERYPETTSVQILNALEDVQYIVKQGSESS